MKKARKQYLWTLIGAAFGIVGTAVGVINHSDREVAVGILLTIVDIGITLHLVFPPKHEGGQSPAPVRRELDN